MPKMVKAMSDAFRRDGESLSEFAAEVKQLTEKDKADLREWFAAEGTVIDP